MDTGFGCLHGLQSVCVCVCVCVCLLFVNNLVFTSPESVVINLKSLLKPDAILFTAETAFTIKKQIGFGFQ